MVDDGSHRNAHLISTLSAILPFMKRGGAYFLEDIGESSFSDNFYDGYGVFEATILGYIASMVDHLRSSNDFVLSTFKKRFITGLRTLKVNFPGN